VGSSASVGFPLTVLNTAVADVLKESNEFLNQQLSSGENIANALIALTKKWYGHAKNIVFNGDGYSDEWVKEAEKRGLDNLKDTPEALDFFKNQKCHQFLIEHGAYKEKEFMSLYNVNLERYVKHREIEFNTQLKMIDRFVIPTAIEFKNSLISLIQPGISNVDVEKSILDNLSNHMKALYDYSNELKNKLDQLETLDESAQAAKISNELLPLSEKITLEANHIENIVPDNSWPIPTYFEMLFVR
jgi:glutamine synthetase